MRLETDMDAFLKTGKLGQGPPKKLSKSKPGSSGTKPKKLPVIPWVEKYRPKTVDEVVEQVDVVSVFRQCLQGADFPNLLLYGPPGSGKTSIILAGARQLFGDMYKDRILELNASDDRGIQVIREKVKSFSQLSASSVTPNGQPCPPFKIVILDEADAMTKPAQAALRRIMEVNAKTTRFCLVCNYVSRIIPPLTSRCTKFRFKPVGVENMLQKLEEICKMENVNCKSETLSALVKCCNGDLRRAITTLQSCGRLKNENEEIFVRDVIEVTEVIPEAVVLNFIDVCSENNYTKMEEMVENFILDAYSTSQLFEQLNDVIINDFKLSDEEKGPILEKLAVAAVRLQDGSSEYIQLLDVCFAIAHVLQMNPQCQTVWYLPQRFNLLNSCDRTHKKNSLSTLADAPISSSEILQLLKLPLRVSDINL